MRIVSGFFRGRKLKAPFGKDIRPTSDMVKESLFNILFTKIEDSIFLDLFSGTGNIGIEALSRGARFCYFVDNNFNSIRCLKDNLDLLDIKGKFEIINSDVSKAIEFFKKKNIKFDIIFIDPPYYKNLAHQTLIMLSDSNILDEDGVIVVEHHKNDIIEDVYNTLLKTKSKKYGETILTFYKEEIWAK